MSTKIDTLKTEPILKRLQGMNYGMNTIQKKELHGHDM